MCQTTTTTTTTTAASQSDVPADRLETKTCGRCGGSGRYSYCQMYGDTCFGCNGRKIVYTKRGLAAHQYLEALRSKPASELKAGDTICDGGRWCIVQEIKPYDTAGWSSMVNGVMQPVTGDFLEVRTNKITFAGWKADKLVRVAQSAEQKQATLKQALAYQATLTKTGKPRASR